MPRNDLERIDPVGMLDELMERLRATVEESPETELVETELAQVRAQARWWKRMRHGGEAMLSSSRARTWTVFLALVPLTLGWSYVWHRLVSDYSFRADLIGGAIEVVVVTMVGVPWIMIAWEREHR